MSYSSFVDYPDELKRAIDNCDECQTRHKARILNDCNQHQKAMNDHFHKYNTPTEEDLIAIDIKNNTFGVLRGRKPTKEEIEIARQRGIIR